MAITKQELARLITRYTNPQPDSTNITAGSLQNITDWNKLAGMRDNTDFGSNPEKLIEDRMAEILPDILPAITDWNELVGMWQHTDFGSNPEKLIEDRMTAVIDQITINDCPDWFTSLLANPNSCPVKSCLDRKVEQLKAELFPLSDPS